LALAVLVLHLLLPEGAMALTRYSAQQLLLVAVVVEQFMEV
jgi:hypothetical protein